MIDLHLHILPGVDDGPATIRESVAMLDWFAEAGYTWLVATPHLMQPLTPELAMLVSASLEQVRPLAEERGIRLETGFEHMIDRDLPARLAGGEVSTLAGSRSVLVEFPFFGWDYAADRVLYDLQQAGYRPVLAHPERYVEAQSNPHLVEAMAERGVVLQITLASLAGTYGGEARVLARHLVSRCVEIGLPFVLASDAHSLGRRLTESAAGRAWFARSVRGGEAMLDWAGKAVPEALLTDQPVPPMREWLARHPATTNPVRGGWRRFRSLRPLSGT